MWRRHGGGPRTARQGIVCLGCSCAHQCLDIGRGRRPRPTVPARPERRLAEGRAGVETPQLGARRLIRQGVDHGQGFLLAQNVAGGRFAGHRLVAPDPQDVVLELEGTAQRRAEAPVRAPRRRAARRPATRRSRARRPAGRRSCPAIMRKILVRRSHQAALSKDISRNCPSVSATQVSSKRRSAASAALRWHARSGRRKKAR